MYHKHHTRGIILASFPEGDGSLRAKILTEDFGLVRARFQGAKETRSKLRSSAQEFSLGTLSLIRGKSGWRVAGASLEKNFFEILKDDPLKISLAANMTKLLKKLFEDEEKNNIFKIALNFLESLENIKNPSTIAMLECLTVSRILHTLGYMKHDPELLIPLDSSEISEAYLSDIAPKRYAMVRLINQSLKDAGI